MGTGRLLPLVMLLTAIGLAWALGLFRSISLAELGRHHQALGDFVRVHPVGAGLLYIGMHAAVVWLAVPVGPVLTIAGGLLFGRWLGLALAIPAATIGATFLFLTVRHALAPGATRHAGRVTERLRDGLRRDGFWYLLSVRLLPVVPYSVGSIAAALVGMRVGVFAAATAIGIVPGTAIFATIGAGFDEIFAHGGQPDFAAAFSPPVLAALVALALLSVSAAWWRRRAS